MSDPFAEHRHPNDPKMSVHLAAAIETPHDHEGALNRPLWVIWKKLTMRDGRTDGPHIDTICDSLEMAYAHVYILLDEPETIAGNREVYVERIPANHRFASSMAEYFTDPSLMRLRDITNPRRRRPIRREGD